MKIYYVANSRMPTIKAYGLQIAKMCEAFSKSGFDCELIIPKRHRYPNTGEGNILDYYDIKTWFDIKELPSWDLIDINLGSFLNKILFWIQQHYFARELKKYLSDKENGTIVFSRDQFSISVLDGNKYKLFWEAHNLPKNIKSGFYKNVLSKIKGLVVISEGLKRDFSRHYKKTIVVAPDGVDFEEFNAEINKEDARKKFQLSLDTKTAVYTGHLYSWKGVDILLKVAKHLRQINENFAILIFGGTKKDVDELGQRIEPSLEQLVQIKGFVPHQQVAQILKAADCAILTGRETEDISAKYTSPLKLFEYMASGCPIVAQRLPSFVEVLNDSNSVLVEPGNPRALAEGINKIFTDNELAEKISRQALEDVKKYTWLERVKKIASIMSA